MAYFKVSISAYSRSYDNGEIDQKDQDDIYYVEADSSSEAIIAAEKIHVRLSYSSYICDSEATEITKDEIPLEKRFYTKKEILISKIKDLEKEISSERGIIGNIIYAISNTSNLPDKDEIEKWENEIERRKSFIKILQPELEKAKQELKILEDIN